MTVEKKCNKLFKYCELCAFKNDYEDLPKAQINEECKWYTGPKGNKWYYLGKEFSLEKEIEQFDLIYCCHNYWLTCFSATDTLSDKGFRCVKGTRCDDFKYRIY